MGLSWTEDYRGFKMFEDGFLEKWKQAVQSAGLITVMTGAGISAESGIPTFRGPEGYWTIGSQEYHPQEMATHSMFMRHPFEVLSWYCYRRAICANANPNPGHDALVDLENLLQDRFALITQNVDGLHLRAGNSLERTFQIHGNINYMRCSEECSQEIYKMGDSIPTTPVSKKFSLPLLEGLRCPRCNELSRPHVLWFDESYNEEYYRFNSSLDIAGKTDVLLVVGTSGATNLPNQVMHAVLGKGGLVVDINIESNVFGELAQKNNGFALQGSGGILLPKLVESLRDV